MKTTRMSIYINPAAASFLWNMLTWRKLYIQHLGFFVDWLFFADCAIAEEWRLSNRFQIPILALLLFTCLRDERKLEKEQRNKIEYFHVELNLLHLLSLGSWSTILKCRLHFCGYGMQFIAVQSGHWDLLFEQETPV